MSQPPNIVLVTIDSLRADHIHGDEAETPAVDSLAADGTAFPDAIAQGPFTTFSMPSLFTGKYPLSLPSIDFVDGVEGVLVDGTATLQERLAANGYTTAGFHSNPLLSELFGFDVGFDHFYDSLDGSETLSSERFQLLLDKLRRLLRTTAYVPATEITDRATTWLAENDEEPFLLWVHYMDVHGPYQSQSGFTYLEKYRSEWLWRKAVHRPDEISSAEQDRLRSTYADEVEYTDASVGDLVAALQDKGYYDDTFIALTADHGEEFAEHGEYSHESKLYDELLRVPLVIKPDAGRDLSRNPAPTPLIDLSATLVDIGDGDTDGMDGNSMLGAQTEQNGVVSEARLPPDYLGSVRTTDWKYIRSESGEELYDLSEDPGETENLSEVETDIRETLSGRLTAHVEEQSMGDDRTGELLETGEIDDRLKSLGYLE